MAHGTCQVLLELAGYILELSSQNGLIGAIRGHPGFPGCECLGRWCLAVARDGPADVTCVVEIDPRISNGSLAPRTSSKTTFSHRRATLRPDSRNVAIASEARISLKVPSSGTFDGRCPASTFFSVDKRQHEEFRRRLEHRGQACTGRRVLGLLTKKRRDCHEDDTAFCPEYSLIVLEEPIAAVECIGLQKGRRTVCGHHAGRQSATRA
ncbi:hypothetical protein M409DRAFT_58164 [Zasmidium cellare ATCC 36951]|uniref:Uncharacterized protein n=1 Tax=Zasmidium cellare ATCC 36951 TaxID=1080233 RepID=A0A6A6C6V5_ZASCE|nr:uncharacterized protein M409DRAFT_58164 [Zasmidium cellare ATCC 36951]KAF2162771.1 hypothetical protein M409DRAFT_58164 [Zasmidium cellare ATCC 36951]